MKNSERTILEALQKRISKIKAEINKPLTEKADPEVSPIPSQFSEEVKQKLMIASGKTQEAVKLSDALSALEETAGLEVTAEGIEEKRFWIRLNDEKFGYEPDGISLEDLEKGFKEALETSAAQAVVFLKENTSNDTVVGADGVIVEYDVSKQPRNPKAAHNNYKAFGGSRAGVQTEKLVQYLDSPRPTPEEVAKIPEALIDDFIRVHLGTTVLAYVDNLIPEELKALNKAWKAGDRKAIAKAFPPVWEVVWKYEVQTESTEMPLNDLIALVTEGLTYPLSAEDAKDVSEKFLEEVLSWIDLQEGWSSGYSEPLDLENFIYLSDDKEVLSDKLERSIQAQIGIELNEASTNRQSKADYVAMKKRRFKAKRKRGGRKARLTPKQKQALRKARIAAKKPGAKRQAQRTKARRGKQGFNKAAKRFAAGAEVDDINPSVEE